MTSFANMTCNVVGLGVTGLSLVRHLRARSASVRVFDGAEHAAGASALAQEFPDVRLTRFDVERDELPACDFIALSPGVPRASVALKAAIKRGVDVLGDIELFARSVSPRARVFGITGSNGKTTTTAIAGELAKCVDARSVVAGNIGLPVLDALAAQPEAVTWILELSSFQLESTDSLELESAAVLNVTANHLDRYSSFFDYAATKARIFNRARRQVINRDDVWSNAMERNDLPCQSFGINSPQGAHVGVRGAGAVAQVIASGDIIVDIAQLKLRGDHNIMNAMAATALMQPLAITTEQTRAVLIDFAGVAHRYQWLGRVAGVDVINDSKATTVVATASALTGNRAPTWLIAGGDGKGQRFDELAVAAANCRSVHLIGRDASQIAAALTARGIPHETFGSMDDAVGAALNKAKAGEVLLLSPACASWDMFRNFEHRAQVFVAAVNAWATANSETLEGGGRNA
jgi:UDP-N-acetylmuramoylalanine--D-glutamate ligase